MALPSGGKTFYLRTSVEGDSGMQDYLATPPAVSSICGDRVKSQSSSFCFFKGLLSISEEMAENPQSGMFKLVHSMRVPSIGSTGVDGSAFGLTSVSLS